MRHVFLAVEFAFYVGAASTLTLTIAALIVAHWIPNLGANPWQPTQPFPDASRWLITKLKWSFPRSRPFRTLAAVPRRSLWCENRDTAVDPNDDLLASYFRTVIAEYLDALADGDCDSCVRLALTRLRADLAAAWRDMYRATFAIVIVAGLSGKGFPASRRCRDLGSLLRQALACEKDCGRDGRRRPQLPRPNWSLSAPQALSRQR
jgi:hypothetical protein